MQIQPPVQSMCPAETNAARIQSAIEASDYRILFNLARGAKTIAWLASRTWAAQFTPPTTLRVGCTER
jgi:hypothetical protein